MAFDTPGKGSLFLACVAVSMLGLTPDAASAKGIRLQYSDRVGETVRYKMVMDAGASEFAAGEAKKSTLRSEMVVSQHIISAADGITRVKTRVDSGSLNADGREVPVPVVGKELLSDMKRNGEVLNVTEFAGLDLKNMQVVFPERDLSVNDSWSMTIAPTPGMPVALNVTYTVAGVERMEGEEVVKIQAAVVSDKQAMTQGFALELKSEGEMYFSPRLGRMVKNEMRSRSSLIRTAGLNNDKMITRISNRIRMESLP